MERWKDRSFHKNHPAPYPAPIKKRYSLSIYIILFYYLFKLTEEWKDGKMIFDFLGPL